MYSYMDNYAPFMCIRTFLRGNCQCLSASILMICTMRTFILESVQDFLIKLDMKTCRYQSSGKKHFFTESCHRQTYQNYEQPPWTSQNPYFQSNFYVLKVGPIFLKKNFYEEYLTRRPTLLKDVYENFDFLDTLFPKIVPNFCRLCS